MSAGVQAQPASFSEFFSGSLPPRPADLWSEGKGPANGRLTVVDVSREDLDIASRWDEGDFCADLTSCLTASVH